MDLLEPGKETIPRLVQAAAARYGDALALEDGTTRLTFADLAREGQRATRAFLAAGVEPGDRVAIWAPNTWEWRSILCIPICGYCSGWT